MKYRLCLRTYAECIRPYMKKKSVFKPNVGVAMVKKESIDGQGIYAFYSMLLDALTNNVREEDLQGIPDISNSLTTNLKSGAADVHNKFVELAQRGSAVEDVEEYFNDYLIPNIPTESLDTINDAIVNLIEKDSEIGATKQEKLKRSLFDFSAARFHAEVLVYAIQRNQNKLDVVDKKKLDAKEDENIAQTLLELERKMQKNQFHPLEVMCPDGKIHIFHYLDKKKSEQHKTSIGDLCCHNSPLMIYGKGGSGKTTFLQFAILELHETVKCRYVRFSDFYQAIKNREILNADNFWSIYGKTDMLFLDGMNEMTTKGFDSSDRVIGKLCAIIEDICHNCNNIRLIISGCFSSRKEAISAFKIITPSFRLAEIKGIPDDNECIRMIHDKMGNPFSELLKRPLYYNAYKTLDVKGVDKCNYDSRYDLLNLFYEQMCQRYRTKIPKQGDFEKIIYSEIPSLAYNMLFDTYRKPILADGVNSQFEAIASSFDTIFIKHVDAEYRTWFSFAHQEYRDFLAAMYVKNRIEDIFCFVPSPPLNLNLNALSDMTATMLIEASHAFTIMDEDFNGVSIRKKIIAKQRWWKKYQIGTADIDFESLRNCIEIGFEIGYYLADPLRHLETGKNIYFKGYEKLIHYYFDIISSYVMNPLASDVTEKWDPLMEKIVRKHIELLRRSKEFDKAFLCLNQLIGCLKGEAKSELLNQKAKLLMYRVQYSHQYDADDFREGYRLLEKCASEGNIMSNNLLGRIYASPSPVVMEYLGENIQNKKRGFLCFYRNVEATLKKKILTPYEKYSYVRCAKMLLHGEISIVQESSVITEGQLTVGHTGKPETDSVEYAKAFLEHADSNSVYALYLHGVVDYYQSNLTFAASEFKMAIIRESYLGRILPSLYLYQILCEDCNNVIGMDKDDVLNEDILNGIREISNPENSMHNDLNFERYHPRYIFEDIKYVLTCLNKTQDVLKMKGVEL